MMKKLFALLLLFGIVGCVTALKFETHASHAIEEDNNYFYTTIYENYEDIKDIDSVFVKLEAMNKDTGETYFRTFRMFSLDAPITWGSYTATTLIECKKIFGSDCFITRRDRLGVSGEEKIFYTSLEDFRAKQIQYDEYVANAKIKAAKDERKLQETIKREQEEKRLAVIHALKERCISYGFTGSNNIAACVQREAQHDYEIEQKEYELQLARQQLLAQQNQQQAAPQVPWYLSILEGVAEGIAEGYKQQALIQTMDSRYEKKDIYRYCRPNC